MKHKEGQYAASDFTKQQLPSTRKALFWDVFRLHFFAFLRLGVLLWAFSLPLIVIGIVRDVSYIQANEQGTSNFLTLVLCDALTPIGILSLAFWASGVSVIYREYVWLEPVFFGTDFKDGIKKNLGPTLLSTLWASVFVVIFYLCRDYFFSIEGERNGFYIAIPFGFLCFAVMPVLYHTVFLNFLYTNPYHKNLKLGMYLYGKHIPSTLLFLLLLFASRLFDWFHFVNVSMLFLKYLVITVLVIFVLPFVLLAAELHEMSIFDKHINRTRFPQLVDKGLSIGALAEKPSSKNENKNAKKRITGK